MYLSIFASLKEHEYLCNSVLLKVINIHVWDEMSIHEGSCTFKYDDHSPSKVIEHFMWIIDI